MMVSGGEMLVDLVGLLSFWAGLLSWACRSPVSGRKSDRRGGDARGSKIGGKEAAET